MWWLAFAWGLALQTAADFLTVTSIALRKVGMNSGWTLANQESSHVGAARVGVVSLRGASLALPSTATTQFQAVFHTGGALMCVLPVGGARVIHLVVLYGYHAEKLGLADLLLDAAVCELAVVVSLQSK